MESTRQIVKQTVPRLWSTLSYTVWAKLHQRIHTGEKPNENSRTKLFCSAILFQLQNLEKKVRVGGINLGWSGNLNHAYFFLGLIYSPTEGLPLTSLILISFQRVVIYCKDRDQNESTTVASVKWHSRDRLNCHDMSILERNHMLAASVQNALTENVPWNAIYTYIR